LWPWKGLVSFPLFPLSQMKFRFTFISLSGYLPCNLSM
jgi:hypothetical protein